MDEVFLTPAKRADFIVTPTASASEALDVEWQDYNRGRGSGNRPSQPLFRLAVASEGEGTSPALPDRLRHIERVDITDAAEREIVIEEMLVDDAITYKLNGVAGGHHDGLSITGQPGEVQIWTFDNRTGTDHPMHTHGFFFQVLEDDGVPLDYLEWVDTVLVRRGKVVKVALPIDDRIGVEGGWMFSCHILDHTDQGLAGGLIVAPEEEE